MNCLWWDGEGVAPALKLLIAQNAEREGLDHVVLAAVIARLNLKILNDSDQNRVLIVGDLQVRSDAERLFSDFEILEVIDNNLDLVWKDRDYFRFYITHVIS
ncbi:hypothetical protein RB2654_23133 [Rhodobacterales bacterium HTCC2654]|uniref:Uncharacterized protein n=1 Tax=Maritimibacter alkaliphilus HTCC2654 TaxID=314271 RepID=A3VM79_9RHOB|nr:hypothetical protein RB2654_23133 [Rhodobacterales bacterium HTCC2654] [Maritimibacter alkaliphilus HTCC2654]